MYTVYNTPMSEFILKLFAMACMAIDHIGLVFFPQHRFLRCIGRIAFPLYAFMIAEGFAHTEKSGHTGKYLIRLALLALLSEIPYDIGLYGTFPRMDHTNVIFTLLVGLLMLYGISHTSSLPLQAVIIVLCAYTAEFIHSSYGYAGVTLILLYHLYVQYGKDKNTGTRILILCGIAMLFGGYYLCHNARSMDPSTVIAVFKRSTWTQTGVLASVPLIAFYNGKKGQDSPVFRWFYRLFYPLHLSVFTLLRIL